MPKFRWVARREPSEVASVAVFWLDLSSYMTGTVSDVTGGRFI